jgi:hypothetical protein
MAREQPTDDQLVEDSHHVLYEMEQIAGAVKRLAGLRAAGQEAPEVDENALLESIVMHARGLIEFTYSDNPRGDDINASDFVPDWREIRPAQTPFLKEVKKRTDKEMMHITRARKIADELRIWTYGKLVNELSLVLAEFIVRVPSEKVEPDFPVRARNAFPIARLREKELKTGEQEILIRPNLMIFGATHAAPDLDIVDKSTEDPAD